MNILIILCCFLKSYRYLQILQLEHYDVKKYLKYIKNNYIFYNLVPMLCFLSIIYLNNDIINFISFVIVLVFLSMATTISIVKLKFTNRIIRIYILLIFIIPLISILNPIIYFLLFEFIVLLPFLINIPIDKKINKKYLLKSTKKFNSFKNIKIGITGSYGKTSTKNILNDMLKKYLLGSCSYKSYNTLLGISKYINDIPIEAYEYVVLEYGASKLGDIKELTTYFNPNIACVTEIGYMHLDTFKTIENIVSEKMSIIDNADVAILNYEQILIREYKTNKKIISYGFNYGNYQARNIKLNSNETIFDLYYNDELIGNIKTKLIGRHQILNLLCGICVVDYLGIKVEECIKNIDDITNTSSRLVLKQYQKYQILDDSYNANLIGSINALEILSSMCGEKILITPGFVENKKVEEMLYLEYSKKIIEVSPFVILVGSIQTKTLQNFLKNNVEYIVVENFKQAMNYVNSLEGYHTILIENDLPDNYKRVI